MKYALIFLLCTVLGFAGLLVYKKLSVSQPAPPLKTVAPFSVETPPPKSKRGTITMSGDVEWQSRGATEPARLAERDEALQGEEYWTKETGNMTIRFPDIVDITIDPNTHINLVQTLPEHFVLLQDSGAAAYQKSPAAAPIAIRALHLLIQQNDGELDVVFDGPLITLIVASGSITVAYNDSNNSSQLVTIKDGNTYSFNDETRTGEITPTDE